MVNRHPPPVLMVLPPKSSQRAARDDQTAQRELASAMRPVRLMLAASIILPIALFLFASWLSFNQHLADARDRVQRNLNTVYEHALEGVRDLRAERALS